MMKRLKMTATEAITFEEGCNKYLDNCRQRNLREGTIKHYNPMMGATVAVAVAVEVAEKYDNKSIRNAPSGAFLCLGAGREIPALR